MREIFVEPDFPLREVTEPARGLVVFVELLPLDVFLVAMDTPSRELMLTCR